MRLRVLLIVALIAALSGTTVAANEAQVYGPELEGFDYPLPVQRFRFESQRQSVQMAYLDAQPEQFNGRTVVLLHGKIFARRPGKALCGSCKRADSG